MRPALLNGLFAPVTTISGIGPQLGRLVERAAGKLIVDLLWQDQIQLLLKLRFPAATDDDLRRAHAYAYGGCVIQDMGYYPFGNRYFSDLVH